MRTCGRVICGNLTTRSTAEDPTWLPRPTKLSPLSDEAPSVRFDPLAHELGPKGIRVNAISAGPIATRAASGIEHFDELLNATAITAPLRRTVESSEVGRTALMLASDYTSAVTGEILHVDSGFHIEGMALPLNICAPEPCTAITAARTAGFSPSSGGLCPLRLDSAREPWIVHFPCTVHGDSALDPQTFSTWGTRITG